MNEPIVRKMTLADLNQVKKIEEASFAIPWTMDIYTKELTENAFAHYYVIEINHQIIGFCGLWIVIDEAQITNIAISPDYRGRGYGEALFQYILNQTILHGAVQLSLEVRVTNLVAQRLYRKFGLTPAGIRKHYYTDNNEDALVMWVNLQ
ncbi:[Ribosomal protein S18]-alanine N-acetyltransferase [Paraliobacillus ryukyuensis]|uniref:[Ribosomal protein bS18]-alanine N-acetyltransferase n=1 Tax=Paraliobacillus ryukyuensis TaxID=200904 RepID=A0A366DMZ7_9BACI|nr:ribosomal protein S18-alanine N-acetyltransferase [Paraliobacillus ryukyuensis]RBO91295.1 [SSU ribosomal protein S18P]-alanine acetyltransferase [Paraliobacillus ryukyuensis]